MLLGLYLFPAGRYICIDRIQRRAAAASQQYALLSLSLSLVV